MSEPARPGHHKSLNELLRDPLIRLVMRADKVDARRLARLIRQVEMSRGAHHDGGDRGMTITLKPIDQPRYRSGVGIMLLNHQNEILVGRRIRLEDAWQMPQGGIEPGEEPRAAALRELREEIGTDNVETLAESKGWLRYELPPDLKGRVWGGCWEGQQQKWFAMRFCGTEDDINVATDQPEFSAWRWIPVGALPELIVAFKRQVYLDVMQEFRSVQETSR